LGVKIKKRCLGHVSVWREDWVIQVFGGEISGKEVIWETRRTWADNMDNIKMDLQEMGSGLWTGLIWLRIGTGVGHL
jgi:hypothetical protein